MKKLLGLALLLLALLIGAGTASAKGEDGKAYVVKKGDTLSEIAQREMGSWRKYPQISRIKGGKVFKIQNPNLIGAGWALWIPLDKVEVHSQPQSKAQSEAKAPKTDSVGEAERPVKKAIADSASTGEPVENPGGAIDQATASSGTEVAPARRPVKFKVRNLADAIASANVSYGVYGDAGGDNKKRSGWNAGAKVEIRPFRFANLGGGRLDVGGYGRYGLGESESVNRDNGRRSDYEYEQYGWGLSLEYARGATQTGLNIGIMHQETDGKTPSKGFASHQTDELWDVYVRHGDESRRLRGEKWLPEWELYGRYLIPFETDYSDSKGRGNELAYDEESLELGGTLWIRDIPLDQEENWFFVPSLSLGIGKNWGKEAEYVKGGPGFRVVAYGQEVVDATVLNPKIYTQGDGDRINWFTVSLKLDDAWRAYRASQVKEYRGRSAK